jgi:hypothetical protein
MHKWVQAWDIRLQGFYTNQTCIVEINQRLIWLELK